MKDDSVLFGRLFASGERYNGAPHTQRQLFREALAAGCDETAAKNIVKKVMRRLSKGHRKESGSRLGKPNNPNKQWQRLATKIKDGKY